MHMVIASAKITEMDIIYFVFIVRPNIKVKGLKADWRRPERPTWKAVGEANERSVKN